jgi:putative membrane-bound dehydrogenase-like protein
MQRLLSRIGIAAFAAAALLSSLRAEAPVLKLLFVGDAGPLEPAARIRLIAPTLIDRGIHPVYTESLAHLTPDTLRHYAAVLVYASRNDLSPAQEDALRRYVEGGGGLVVVNGGASAFAGSEPYARMVGARLRSGPVGQVSTELEAKDHPLTRGFQVFSAKDEAASLDLRRDAERTVLETRSGEPWTWVRGQGRGRVFYTAWGREAATWGLPAFHDLLERAVRYVGGQDEPADPRHRPAIARLERVPQTGIPYYSPGQRTSGEGQWQLIQKPLTPEASMQRLVVPGGFAVELVAADPEIRKPIAMAWDERGRLWLAETLDYPNVLRDPGAPGRDRLLICDDRDGDGRMDTFTVFADGLNIPTGFTFARGGVIVVQAPHTLFLRDHDGDDRADEREILFTGWGRYDTHAGPSNLVSGPDNWIWGTLGYSGFTGSVGGEAHNVRQGFIRFRPDGTRFEYLRATNNNTWGLGFREDGIAFASTANNNPSVYLPISNRIYSGVGADVRTLGGIADTSRFVALTDRVRQVDVHWGYTAAAGHAFYTARSYPREYWNRVAFVTEPTGHLVGEFIVEPTGANFRSANPTNLIASDDEWFAPIMAEVGPDGAVWVIDWYNYIVQHNPTPKGFERGAGNAYENPLRDQRHGRIYRVVWRGDGSTPQDKKPARFSLAGAKPDALVAALGHDNLLWRRHAQRLLVERGRKDIVPALLARLADSTVDELGLNPGALHALWTLEGLNAVDAIPEALEAVTQALGHPAAAVRRAAALALPRTPATVAALLKAGTVADTDAQVRFATLVALADAPVNPDAGRAVHAFLDRPSLTIDRWMAEAAQLAALRHARGFLAAARPEQRAAAEAEVARRNAPGKSAPAVLPLETFETTALGAQGEWTLNIRAGQATAEVVDGGRSSHRSLRITAEAAGADVALTRTLKVKPHTRYEVQVSGRTESVETRGNALGALIAVPDLHRPQPQQSVATRGTSNWSSTRLVIDTGPRETLPLSLVLGAGGKATGKAWFDDVTLVDLGRTDEQVENPLEETLVQVVSRSAVRTAGSDTERDAVVVQLGVVPDVMKYDRTELTVKAGDRIRLIFRNTDHMQHNALLLAPGTTDTVGALADAMLSDPRALSKNYVPASPDVLAYTPLVNPGETFELVFTAPSKPGRYPIICTFPGHWRIMQSTLIVQ